MAPAESRVVGGGVPKSLVEDTTRSFFEVIGSTVASSIGSMMFILCPRPPTGAAGIHLVAVEFKRLEQLLHQSINVRLWQDQA